MVGVRRGDASKGSHALQKKAWKAPRCQNRTDDLSYPKGELERSFNHDRQTIKVKRDLIPLDQTPLKHRISPTLLFRKWDEICRDF